MGTRSLSMKRTVAESVRTCGPGASSNRMVASKRSSTRCTETNSANRRNSRQRLAQPELGVWVVVVPVDELVARRTVHGDRLDQYAIRVEDHLRTAGLVDQTLEVRE